MKTPTEHEEQVHLMTWARLNAWKYPALKRLIAIPNGGLRNQVVAIKLRQEGVKPGVSDLFLAHPQGAYAGMWLELKRAKGGRVTQNQKDWITDMLAAGYWAMVCHGWDQAREALIEYLEQE